MSTANRPPQVKTVCRGFYDRFLNDQYFRLVSCVIFVWGFLDTASTYVAIIAYGTVEYEWNPITRELLMVDPILLIAGKGIALLAVGLLAIWGRGHIMAVPGWKLFFNILIWSGVVVMILNLYAAYMATTGHDPIFSTLF